MGTIDCRLTEAQLRRVMEVVDDGIVVQDAADEVVLVNGAASEMRGLTDDGPARGMFGAPRPGSPAGLRVLDAQGRDVPSLEWPAARAARREPYRDLELTIAAPDAAPWIGRFGGAIVPQGDGGRGLFVTVVRDVTARRRAEEALRGTEQRLELAHRLTNTGAWDLDLVSGRVWASPEYRALLGIEGPVQSGDEVRPFLHPDDMPEMVQRAQEAMRSNGEWDVEYRVLHPVLGERWIAGLGRFTRDESGRPVRMLGIGRDITARKLVLAERERLLAEAERARDELRERTEQLREITDAVPVHIAYVDRDLCYRFVNAPYELLFARPREAIIGQPVAALMSEEAIARALPYMMRALAGESVRFENTLRVGDRTVTFDARMVPHRSEGGEVVGYYAVVDDATALKQAEAALRELNQSLEARVVERTAQLEEHAARLRLLAAELTDSEQRERRRLADLVHDHLQQLLVAARLRLQAMGRQLADPAAAGRLLADAETILAEAGEICRSLAVELHPPVLQDEGLEAALRWLARWMQERHRLEVTVAIEEGAEPADERARTLLFTAVRELLFNVVKHAGVAEATVELRRDRRHVHCGVADRGAGFDPAAVEAGQGGFGLFGVRERVRALGGEVTIEARPGEGTRVELILPAEGSGRRRPARPGSASSAAPPARARGA